MALQVTYLAFSDAEEKLIAAERKQGMQAVLSSPQVGRRVSKRVDACSTARSAALLTAVQAPTGCIVKVFFSAMSCCPSPQGRAMNPHLRALLLSGMVQLRVPRADNLPVSSLFGRPSV